MAIEWGSQYKGLKTMPKYWMISNRTAKDGAFGVERDRLSYWISDKGHLDTFGNWQNIPEDEFKSSLIAAADQFPIVEDSNNENQSHITFFVHGYNNGWQDAARRYEKLCGDLFSDGLGLCISFDWPSFGSVVDYLPDRGHARQSADDLSNVLSEIFDWLIEKQKVAIKDPALACKAKLSLICHSMGNYVLQKAMAAVWTRKNQPLLVSLINQLIMVAADVDNDLFESNASDGSDGDAVANLTYRISVLYSGRDAVLGASAGLKHFGTRRLGRSGLSACPPDGKDNIWEVDCSGFFPASVGSMNIHSAYFDTESTLSLIQNTLRGIDRSVLERLGLTKGTVWPEKPKP
jgi:esterase/lipase superfamily enzyme